MASFIYHIVLPAEWLTFASADFFEAPSLQTEGFIHCSYENQIRGVVERYYAETSEIALLTLDPARITAPLVAEAAKNGEMYPHIYGRINKDAIVEVKHCAIVNGRIL